MLVLAIEFSTTTHTNPTPDTHSSAPTPGAGAGSETPTPAPHEGRAGERVARSKRNREDTPHPARHADASGQPTDDHTPTNASSSSRTNLKPPAPRP
jgi:hypothetical protein